jgi:ArsR family transcriptional regulator
MLKILSDVNRLRIINLLLEEELCVCEMQEVLDLTQVTVSKRLSKMKETSLVNATKTGNRVFYSLSEEAMSYQWLLDLLKGLRLSEDVLASDVKLLKNHDIVKQGREYSCPTPREA